MWIEGCFARAVLRGLRCEACWRCSSRHSACSAVISATGEVVVAVEKEREERRRTVWAVVLNLRSSTRLIGATEIYEKESSGLFAVV